MTDQKLVDELEKALRDEAYDGGFGYMGDEQFTAYVRTLAEAAAEVVEKALTPTNDEREAQANRYTAGRGDSQTRRDFLAGWDAALRRTEVPEPSAEEPECFAEKPDWPEHWTMNDKLRDLHARWHEQKGNLIGREECGYERCEFWDAAEFTLRLADVRIAGREPQGEPSDAAVSAALESYWGHPDGYTRGQFEKMRAALRAAGGAR